ncbi:hypothetical protein B0H11DRAFT_2089641, partial [Mycena galericulata]
GLNDLRFSRAAPFVNSLSIKGRIHAKARGKELIYLFRVNFGLEGHCFWMPSSFYHQIVSQPPIHRGEKSYAFLVPDELVDGPPVGGRKISIQAAFIRPKWTLVFVDHNVMIQFHVMQASGLFHHSHLQPGSGAFHIWPFLWSYTHGPVYSQEPKETLECLTSWRQKTIVADDWMAIFEIMKSEQTVFNGTGAQEATDQLAMALIHPQMAAVHVCSDDALWRRFHYTIIKYDKNRTDLALPGSPLPYVSGPRPFRLNQDGHNKYLSRISCYRRSEVVFDIATLNAAHENGLFLPKAIIQANGRAIVPANAIPTPPSVRTTLRADRPQATVKVPNFALTWRSGKGKQATYSPFTAKPHAEWQKSTRETLGFDVREDVNNTTLGLYSFRILVDCVWSAKFVAKAGVVPLGRRPTIKSGKSNSKRPRAEDIVKTGAPKKRRVCLDEKENIEVNTGIRTRSGKSLS